MWQWFLREWFDRNEKMHGVDLEAKERKKRETAIRKARWLCDLKDKVMPRHRDIFHSNFGEHCDNMSKNQLTTWNNMSAPMTMSSVQCAKRTNAQGTHGIRRWMTRLRTTPEDRTLESTSGDAVASESSQVCMTPTKTHEATRDACRGAATPVHRKLTWNRHKLIRHGSWRSRGGDIKFSCWQNWASQSWARALVV